MHRLKKPIWTFAAEAGGSGESGASGTEGGSGSASSTNQEGPQQEQQTQTFTQADVDRIVRERVQRERAKYSDYDDLKTKAEGAKTLEERIADLETKGSQSEQRALRAEIAAEFGISTKRGEKDEPSDADLFLTATDAAVLRKQAERFAARESGRRQRNNHVPGEGNSSKPPVDEERAAARSLFGTGG